MSNHPPFGHDKPMIHGAQLKNHLQHARALLAPLQSDPRLRLLLSLARRLPLPGLRWLARGLGRLGPLLNIALAIADIWIAVDDVLEARKDPELKRLIRATLSVLLASCAVIAALNIPFLSQLAAITAMLLDFLKQSLLTLMEPAPATAQA